MGSAGLIHFISFSGVQRPALLLSKLDQDAHVVSAYLLARNWECFTDSCIDNMGCLLAVEMDIIYLKKLIFLR